MHHTLSSCARDEMEQNVESFPFFVTEAIKVKYPIITYADLYQVTATDLVTIFVYQGLLQCLPGS